MNRQLVPHSTTRLTIAAAISTCFAFMAPAAKADNYALIMAIDYRGTSAALPGIDKDAEIARRIAEQLNVPRGNIRSLSGPDLSSSGVRAVLSDLANRVGRDDSVFIYYSGHGTQDGAGGGKCREGMVGADLKVIWNDELTGLLTRVAEGSSRMVVMNDSCFSGGQMSASKAVGDMRGAGAVPKLLDLSTKAPSTDIGAYECGSPINKAFRDLGVVANKRGNNYVYLAASSDREVAFATPLGSAATRAWQACLSRQDTDTNRDGMVSGAELRVCAQGELDRMQFNQRVQTHGAEQMPLVGAMGGGGGSIRPTAMLDSIRAGANSDVSVELSVENPVLRIDRDYLNFTVKLDRGGYLYLLHTGPDGKFHVLFPNKRDADNRFASGRHVFPRKDWAIQAQGPISNEPGGLIAVLTEQPRDFAKDLDISGVFPEGEVDASMSRKLAVVATSARYGASQVVRIREVR